ncbi:MAG TPA: amino acid permease [Gaiellaceae bacterium]|nr:amino acid permease [Gaiellaceae bacterium]
MSSSEASATGHIHLTEDERILHRLGYAQELFRAMSAFRNFAISFTIISILAGCLTSFYLAFQWGGPVSVTWGWIIVGTFTTFVALSMAEIASSYPTAGGLYFWSSKLGNPGWGWFTGWFNWLGLIGIIGAVAYGLATYATALSNLLWGYPNDRHHIFYLFAAFIAACTLLNVFDVRITSLINEISAWWHVVGVAIIVIALIVVPSHHQSAGYVFGQTINNSGFHGSGWSSGVFWMVFAIGSIGMAQYTLTGYDASAHMAEETHKASRGAATGMLWSVVVSVIAGFILLTAVTFAIPNQTEVQSHYGDIVTWIWQTSMSTHWAEFLLFIIVIAQFYCLTACITSGSRMMFAFSRDRAMPGHQAWRTVSRHRVPVWAAIAVGFFGFLLLVPTWWNNLAGYYVGTSVGTTSLYIAFILPVILRVRQGDRFQPGAWTLGNHRKWINPIAILWVVFISVIFMLPTVPQGMPWRTGFTWNDVNYAPLTIVGAFILFGGWWVLSAKNWFKGPVRMGTEEELEQLEEKQEDAFLLPADTEFEGA